MKKRDRTAEAGRTGRRSFKDMKLASKTSIVIGVILLLSLTALVTVSAITANVKLRNSIYEEFSGIATQNGILVQNILDTAASTAQNLQDYLERSYEDQASRNKTTTGPGGSEMPVQRKSDIYNVNISAYNK